jgi:hypothetical protein
MDSQAQAELEELGVYEVMAKPVSRQHIRDPIAEGLLAKLDA